MEQQQEQQQAEQLAVACPLIEQVLFVNPVATQLAKEPCPSPSPQEEEEEEASTDTEAAPPPPPPPWDGLYEALMPLLVSMTFNSPLQFWELNYMQQHDRFDIEENDLDKLNSLAVWFGYESIAVALSEIKRLIPSTSSPILDLGCGNGHVCELLLALGYSNVYGLDFSEAAIELAKSVRKFYREKQEEQEGHTQGLKTNHDDIHYIVSDALATDLERGFFDAIYDKGTFDSIACVSKKIVKVSSSERDADEETEDEDDRIRYCQEVKRLLKPGGYFFMTSQCHDEHELLQFFSQSGDGVWEGCKFILVQNLTHNFVDLRLMIFQKPV